MDIREELEKRKEQLRVQRKEMVESLNPTNHLILTERMRMCDWMLRLLEDKQILILEPGEIGLRITEKEAREDFLGALLNVQAQLKQQLGAEDEKEKR